MSRSFTAPRRDFLGKPAPPGYIAGVGRGATGFTTRSDIGPARETFLNQAAASSSGEKRISKNDDADEEGEYLNESNYDEFTGYGGSLFNKEDPYEEDDREADRIYEEIERHVDERGKAIREKRQRIELEKYRQERPKIQQQFSDLTKDLKNVSEEEWMSLPEVGDARNRKQRVARQDKFTPIPDSLIAHRAKMASGGETLVYVDPKTLKDPEEIPDEDADSDVDQQSQSLAKITKPSAETDSGLVNIGEMSEFRSSYISMRLSNVSQAIESQKSADPQDYLTNLQSMVPSQIKDASLLKEYRKQFSSLRASNPNYPKAWIASVRLEEAAGKLKAARSLILAACEQCPKSVDVWCEAVRLHPVDEAKAILVKALKEIPRSVQLWIQAADLENEDVSKRKVFEKARSLIPKSPLLWKKSVELEPTDSAVRILREAVECCPESVDLWLALARLEPYEKAREVLVSASDNNPGDRSIWIMASKLEEKAGNVSLVGPIIRAAKDKLRERGVEIVRADWFNEAIDADKAGYPLTCREIVHQLIGWNLGDCDDDKQKLLSVWLSDAKDFASKNSPSCARAVYEAIVNSENGKGFHLVESVWLAWCEFERVHGDQESLVSVLKRAIRSENCIASEQLWLMLADLKRCQLNETRQILADALDANPDSEKIILAAVELECENKNSKEARRILADACMSAKSARLVMRLAELERTLGNLNEATRVLKSGIEDYKDYAQFYLTLGQIEEQKGDTNQAKSYYSAGLKFSPTSVDLWISLASLEERTGFVARARSKLEMARLRNPKVVRLWLESARLELRAFLGKTTRGATSRPDVVTSLLAKGVKECRDQPDVDQLVAEQALVNQRKFS